MSSVRKIQLPDNTTVDINDERFHIYRTLTGTAAVTADPYYCSRWDVTDETITEYTDGMVVCLKVPVAGNGTYGTGFQINNLGYKPVVYNISSMVSTRYGVGSVVWAVYNSTQTASLYLNSDSATTVTGCWQVNDYGVSDTNSIGYQLRTNSSVRPTVSRTRYYRILFSSADNTQWVPANTGYDNSATSKKTVKTTPINPFGRIVYMSGTTNVTAGSNVGAAVTWDQYALTLGYSFNTTGSALTLTYPAPVYIKCEPQADGSAIIDSTTPYVQALPSTADGKIYIYLGQAYSETQVEMTYDHPIYYHDGTQIRQYSGDKTGGSSTLSELTDTTITTPSNGQVLTYDNTTSKWVNANAEKEIFWCTMTSTTENGVTTWSCDKTWGEIYAAYQGGKLVCLKADGIFYPNIISQDEGLFTLAIEMEIFGRMFAVNSFHYSNNSWTKSGGVLNIDTLESYPNLVAGNAGQVLTIGSGVNSNYLYWANVPTELPSITGNANKVLAVNNSATGVEWVTKPSSGLTNYDFTHTANTTISGSTTTVTFAANTRGSQTITVSDDIAISFVVNNNSDNYLWIENSDTTNNIDVTISSVTHNGNIVSSVRMPRDGIAVPAGGTCEISIVCNADGAFITSRDDLE